MVWIHPFNNGLFLGSEMDASQFFPNDGKAASLNLPWGMRSIFNGKTSLSHCAVELPILSMSVGAAKEKAHPLPLYFSMPKRAGIPCSKGWRIFFISVM